ncbi:MAG: hypothetical protein DWQ03_14100 [Calditrichaeota bacterium]|nr:MAG: hypothetical protein DWQ03_14100 [Calditrichota bacterium]NOG47551.1 hypothetical protein [Calditrichota bacterium]
MNLDYIHKNDIHEKYVLGKLTSKEKTAYEAFLKENKQAQKELQETLDLIEGLRETGTDSMRREIERQVEEIRSPKADWSIIYKAAAVLFIFVLLPSVIYFQLFDKPEELIAEKTTPAVYEEQMSEEEGDELIAQRVGGAKDKPVQESRKKIKKSEANELSKLEEPKRQRKSLQDLMVESEDDAIGETETANPQIAKLKKLPAEQITLGESADIAGSEISANKLESADLDNTLNAAGGYASGSSGMRSSAPLAKQKGLVSSVSKESALKNYSFKINKNDIRIMLSQNDSIRDFPKSFPVKVIEKNQNSLSLQLDVSNEIYLIKKDNILVTWNNKDSLLITFLNQFVYKVNLDSATPKAKKIKEN